MQTTQAASSDLPIADLEAVQNREAGRKRAGIVARMLHGTGAGAVAYGMGIFTNLILLPLYLRHWSVAEYGEWMALYSFVGYLGSLDFGVTTAAVNAASMAYARGDLKTFKSVQGTAWATSIGLAGIGGCVVAALVLFSFHINQWLGLTVFSRHDARLICFWTALSLLAGLPGRQLAASYISVGEFPKYQWIWNLSGALSVIVTIAALSLGAYPVVLAELNSVVTLVTIATTYALLWRRDPLMVPRVTDFHRDTARTLAVPTSQFGISMIATALTLQGPIVILSRALGGPAVALFVTTRTVANVVRATLTLLRAPLRPEFAAAATQTSKYSLQSLFRIAVGVDTIVAVSLSAGLWSGGVWLIRYWSHGRILPDPNLLHLLLALFALEGFLQMLASVGSATNRLCAVSFGQLAAAVISLCLATALLRHFGPSAIPLGGILSLLVLLLPLALHNASSEIEVPVRAIVLRMFLPFICVAGLSFFWAGWLAKDILLRPWLRASIAFVTTGLLCLAVVFALFLNRNDRKSLRKRVDFRFNMGLKMRGYTQRIVGFGK